MYKQVGSLSRGLKIAHLYKRNVSGRVTLLPGTELRTVIFNKRGSIFPETFTARPCFPYFSQFPSFPYRKHCFQCHVFSFQDANHAYATLEGILTKIRACENLQKFCEHEQANTRLIFVSNSSKGQILQAISN